MTPTPGTRVGFYEILAPLGAGGMGEVYRARDLRLGREIALKVLPAGMSTDAERLARFEREAHTVARLNHPNIVTLHSIESDGDVRFLTMELVEGRTLSDLVLPGGLPVAQLLDLAIHLTDALVAAHEIGVVHRDLKPANVMVTKDGRVKVLDFGLAKLMDSQPDPGRSQAATVPSPITDSGRAVGTVPYMAPEQVRGEAVDSRTDLFALGVVLYELASGKRPFAGETHVDVGHAILREAPSPLASVRDDLPPDLHRIVDRCLEKSPRERAQSALDVGNELRRLRKELDRNETASVARPAAPQVASIAVLPFANRSASADDEYFSDGLADELLGVLSKIRGLRVTARTSAFQFKGTKDDVATIGRKLNVATLLEGSMRKAGNRIRVSVQLVSVADSSHLWSEIYDRTLDDIFAVQEDIAQSVVKELRTTLLGEQPDSDASGAAKAEVAAAAKGRGTDPEAHRLVLLARHLFRRFTREETANGIGYLQEALERDPGHALAWAELAGAYARQAEVSWSPAAEGYPRAREAVERALALEPDLPDGHATLGRIRMDQWDLRGAEASYSRALELSPGNAYALKLAGTLAESRGRFEHAIDLYRRSLDQDPLSGATYHNLGLALLRAGRLAESEQAFRTAMELAPHADHHHATFALTLLALGRGEEALAAASGTSAEAYGLWALGIIHAALGHEAEAQEALRQLIEKHAEGAAFQIAEVYGARDEVDAAFEWLERAYAQRDAGLLELRVSPQLRPCHGDPRWGAFVKKVGFED